MCLVLFNSVFKCYNFNFPFFLILSHLGSLNNNYGANVFEQWQVLWFKHDRAGCVLDATGHHGKKVMAWETTSTGRHSSCTSSHQILSTTIHLKCLQVLHRSKLLHQRKWPIYRLTWGIFVKGMVVKLEILLVKLLRAFFTGSVKMLLKPWGWTKRRRQ